MLDVLMNHVFLAPVRVFLLAPFAPEISDLLRSERIPGREGKTRVAARTHNARACSLALALVLSIPLPFSRPRSPPSAHAHTDRWRVRAVCLNSYLLRLVRHIPLEGPHFALLERTLDVEDAGLRERHIALHVSGVQGAWAMTMLAAAPGGRRRARWLCPCRRPTRRARQAAAPTPRAASSAAGALRPPRTRCLALKTNIEFVASLHPVPSTSFNAWPSWRKDRCKVDAEKPLATLMRHGGAGGAVFFGIHVCDGSACVGDRAGR